MKKFILKLHLIPLILTLVGISLGLVISEDPQKSLQLLTQQEFRIRRGVSSPFYNLVMLPIFGFLVGLIGEKYLKFKQ